MERTVTSDQQRTIELRAEELRHIDDWLELARLAEEDTGPLHYPLTNHRQLYLSQRAWLMDHPASSLPRRLKSIVDDAIRRESQQEKVVAPQLGRRTPTSNADPSLDWADEVEQHIYNVTRHAPGPTPGPRRDFSDLRSSSRDPWSSLHFRRRRTSDVKRRTPLPIPPFAHTVHSNLQSRVPKWPAHPPPPRPHYPLSFDNSPHRLYPHRSYNSDCQSPGCDCICHFRHHACPQASRSFSPPRRWTPRFIARTRRFACVQGGVDVLGKPGTAGQVLSTRRQWQGSWRSGWSPRSRS